MILPLNRRVIYALVDPRDGVVRYVGVTDKPSVRYKDHLRDKRTSRKAQWVQELAAENLVPTFVFIDSSPFEESLECERKWMKHFSKLGELFDGRDYKKELLPAILTGT